MNNTTPIKILTAAVLLTFGFALTANAALINKGVTEMNHEYTVSWSQSEEKHSRISLFCLQSCGMIIHKKMMGFSI